MGLIFSSVVPVVWNDFQLSEKSEGVLIDWATEKEIDNKGFSVQRSSDGIEWIDIEFVNAKDINGSQYHYLDNRALPGVNYYRLKQEDLDGSFTYSVIKSIGIGKRKLNTDIRFYPNPVVDYINLEWNENEESQRVQIRNINNILLYDQFFYNTRQLNIDVVDFPAGHYILSIQAKDWAFNKYFIKQ
jgi:hypothetical protein